jgi:hypothetical protein
MEKVEENAGLVLHAHLLRFILPRMGVDPVVGVGDSACFGTVSNDFRCQRFSLLARVVAVIVGENPFNSPA